MGWRLHRNRRVVKGHEIVSPSRRLGASQAQYHEERELIAGWNERITSPLECRFRRGNIYQSEEFKACLPARVNILLERALEEEHLDTRFRHAAIGNHRLAAEIVLDVTTHDKRIGIVQREDAAAAGFEGGGQCTQKATMVRDIVEDHVAGGEIELALKVRRGLTEVAQAPADGALWVPRMGERQQ